MFVDNLVFAKGVATVNTGSQQDLKSASEGMLMNGGGTVEPVIDVDIKPSAREHRYRRISETPLDILLLRKRHGIVYPANDFPGIDARRQVRLGESLRGNFGEYLFIVVL